MTSRALAVCALALLLSWTTRASRVVPEADARGSGMLKQLLARGEDVEAARRETEDTPPGRDPHAVRVSRMDKLTHLSDDMREFMTKQITQAISEMVNSECMSNRDYQGWVDFGRRSAE